MEVTSAEHCRSQVDKQDESLFNPENEMKAISELSSHH